MVDISQERLGAFGPRVRLERTAGDVLLPADTGVCDRFVSTYVLDLMAEERALGLIDEAGRVLREGGMLCLVSLTRGETVATRIVSGMWNAIYRVNARLVGGCRPIELGAMIANRTWNIEYATKISSFGLTSEVVVARKR
tara:strand:+ start:209 stop:628 length:420 start_codon:yes stop_codon:yes gene_type:complete